LSALIDLVQPELVKVNRAEAGELVGASFTIAELARLIRGRSSGLVVITDGPNGSVALAEGEPVWSQPVSLIGAYPVGSGDSFLAGFLVATVRGLDLDRALAVAAACAAANAEVPGAAIFERSETLRMLAVASPA
jgi:fructose-1-phosphate kinase PfkB-like protein